VSEFDRIETQQETNAELRRLSRRVTELAQGLAEVAVGLEEVAHKGDKTAERLEESIQVMEPFATSQVKMRKTIQKLGCG
jgi:methyl-accepting chemotaxis protein